MFKEDCPQKLSGLKKNHKVHRHLTDAQEYVDTGKLKKNLEFETEFNKEIKTLKKIQAEVK